MRGAWERLSAEFSKHLLASTVDNDFKTMAGRHKALAGFESPSQVVAHQHAREPTHDEHDRVGHALILEYQRSQDRRSELAGSILLLALSPGLLHVFRRVLPLFGCEDDAATDVCLALFEQARKWRPEKTDRVAVNLVRNSLRTVLEARDRSIREARRVGDLTAYGDMVADFTPDAEPEPDADRSETCKQGSADAFWRAMKSPDAPYEPDDPEIEWLQRVLTRAPGVSPDDALLFALRVPCAMSWEAIGARLGVKPETLRKRYRKLAERLPGEDFLERHVPGFRVDPRICL